MGSGSPNDSDNENQNPKPRALDGLSPPNDSETLLRHYDKTRKNRKARERSRLVDCQAQPFPQAFACVDACHARKPYPQRACEAQKKLRKSLTQTHL